MNLKDDCLRNKGHEKDSHIICKDGDSQSQYRLTNNSNSVVCKYQLDGCLINDNSVERCDFLLTIQSEKNTSAIFVELKGKKFLKAISQVSNSIDKLKPDNGQYKVFARIVMSTAPRAQGPAYFRLSEKVVALNGNLEIRSRVLSENTTVLL